MANIITRAGQLALRKVASTVGLQLVPDAGYTNMPYTNSLWGGFSKSGEPVNDKTVNELSTYYASCRNISEDIAKLPYLVAKVEPNGNRILDFKHNAAYLLQVAPNNYTTPIAFKEAVINDGLKKGNGYAYIETDANGRPQQLHYIPNQFVFPEFDKVEKRLYYLINYPLLNLNGYYADYEVFHFRGQGNTMIGASVLQYQLQTMGEALALQGYSSEYFANGASMSGMLSFEGVSDEKKLQVYADMFMASFKRGGIAAMPSGVDFKQMSTDPQKSQLLESRNFMRGEIARWFRMPLSKLQDQTNSNNNSLEQDNISYVTDCLYPWIIRFQQEADKKLFAPYERKSYDGFIDTEELLRGDSAAMERKARTLYATGAATSNEIRTMYKMNTISEENSNVTYVPSNMIPSNIAQEFWQGQANKNLNPTQSQPGLGGAQQ